MKKLLLVMIIMIGCTKTTQEIPVIVLGADGYSYELIKPEVKKNNGEIEIAEYIRMNSDRTVHYFMRMQHGDNKPYFSKLM